MRGRPRSIADAFSRLHRAAKPYKHRRAGSEVSYTIQHIILKMATPESTKMFSLEGQTALVTGGTRGIGQAAAIALAEAGADIILIQVYFNIQLPYNSLRGDVLTLA